MDLSFFDNISFADEGLSQGESSFIFENGNGNDPLPSFPVDVLEANAIPDPVMLNNEAGILTNKFGIPSFDEWYSQEYGTPVEDSLVWHQQTTPFTCGIVSSEMIMRLFGLDISEAHLVYEATSQGLLTDNGMTLDGIHRLLENHGIQSQVADGAGITDLVEELKHGHKIVVALDSGEIWNEDPFWEDFIGERADHAVVVTGVDLDERTAILNDPGHPEGKAMTISLDKFMDAWNDSNNGYIATDTTPMV